jgi:hypothetical protein
MAMIESTDAVFPRPATNAEQRRESATKAALLVVIAKRVT